MIGIVAENEIFVYIVAIAFTIGFVLGMIAARMAQR